MNGEAPEPPTPPFGSPSLEQVTGLVFELASQLHVERARRIALEAALEAAGTLAAGACDRMPDDPQVRDAMLAALDSAMKGLTRVLGEDPDPRTPLRTRSGTRTR